jgi:hypothetical protein
MRRSVLSIVLMLFASPLAGQTPSLESGAPLRVHARGFTMSGELVRLNADTLVLRPQGTERDADLGSHRAIAVSDVLRLDRQVPRTRARGAARGALWGLVIGGVAGAVLGAIDGPCKPRCYFGPATRSEAVLWGGAALGLLGTGAGALVGTAWPGSRWEPAPLPLAKIDSY